MLVKNLPQKKKLLEKLCSEHESHDSHLLSHIVDEILGKKASFLALAAAHQTPFYAFDELALREAAQTYRDAFEKSLPLSRHFYAVKVNHYPELLRILFAMGFGADVSSARELQLALAAGAKEIVFSGPGKTVSELTAAVSHHQQVIINIDSFGELKKLQAVAAADEKIIRAGVRVSFKEHGAWGKFGIPLSECNRFFAEASSCHNIDLIGIQFHISWNADAEPYEIAIKTLGNYLTHSFEKRFLSQIKFIDLGGGFRPYNAEGFYPEDTALGAAIQAACDAAGESPEFTAPYYITEALPISAYAEAIGTAVDTHLRPLLTCEFYTEPGRIICNNSLHVVLQVEDVKSDSCIIVNGGTNIVGFERFEFDYFPLINLNHPSSTEMAATVYGSLCMPQDYWGLYLFASQVEEGDIIIVPYQGALTYANMQDFIKGPVPVYALNKE